MHQSFAHDFKVMRKKSGLSQKDCAHLLGVDQSRISHLESGERAPSLRQICQLSLIFGKAPESLLADAFAQARTTVSRRLSTLPRGSRRFCRLINRQRTLEALAARLENSDNERGGRL
ncbi:helix-turn-helix domain-containing protein [uncultured Roseibium sp.]|uniref:helix-turn-helix transcriptional regulator n=1 Tax=uncultured Roseibium sp. TaxID=1936171 RepID=UPI0032167E76